MWLRRETALLPFSQDSKSQWWGQELRKRDPQVVNIRLFLTRSLAWLRSISSRLTTHTYKTLLPMWTRKLKKEKVLDTRLTDHRDLKEQVTSWVMLVLVVISRTTMLKAQFTVGNSRCRTPLQIDLVKQTTTWAITMSAMEAWIINSMSSSKICSRWVRMMRSLRRCSLLMIKKLMQLVPGSSCKHSKMSCMILLRIHLKIWRKWVIFSRFVVAVIIRWTWREMVTFSAMVLALLVLRAMVALERRSLLWYSNHSGIKEL